MTSLTREEIGRLGPEEQKQLARLEAQHVAAQEQLQRRVRGQGGTDAILGTLMGVTLGLALFGIWDPRALTFSIILLVGLVGFQFRMANRRMDALNELMARQSPSAIGRGPKGDAIDSHQSPGTVAPS
jgi:hypothetical protein